MKPHSQKFLQRRKFVMVVPVLVLPFLIMIFWALGGGQGSPGQTTASEKAGLNLNLPDAHFNDETWNKLSLYEQAERDSLKLEEEKRNDPYIDLAPIETQDQQEIQQEPLQKKEKARTGSSRITQKKQAEVVDPNEAKVNQKLDQLYQELNKKQESPFDSKNLETVQPSTSDPQFTSDVKQLEKMMGAMKVGDQPDPEMQQIDGMLEKIMDIQHPDRAAEKIKKESELKKGQVFPVLTKEPEENFSLLHSKQASVQIPTDSSALLSKVFPTSSQQNGFYGLEDEITEEQENGNTIEAAVHDTQELVAGSTIKLRLLNDVYINGKHISKDQLIYGTCSINGERLTVAINSIRDDNFLFPVSLTAFDLDGIEGIYIPGAITRDVAKQSSDQALQGMQFMSIDQSLKTQAASAGIQTAKSLFSKKVKLIKVTVKAGYKLLLKDKKTDNS